MTTKTIIKKSTKVDAKVAGVDFFKNLWGKGWVNIKTVVNIVEEPVLILDKNFCVVAANNSFYQTFQVKNQETEGKSLFELGNSQWNISKLKKFLKDVLLKEKFFKGFEVSFNFPIIGQKVMILNARQLYLSKDVDSKKFSPIILLAIEDITEIMSVADKLLDYTNDLGGKFSDRIEKLEACIKRLEKEINDIKIKI